MEVGSQLASGETLEADPPEQAEAEHFIIPPARAEDSTTAPVNGHYKWAAVDFFPIAQWIRFSL